MGDWQLFIDESGNFDQPGDTCIVAGILVHASMHPRRDADVRAALGEAYPGLRYPPHATKLRFLSGRVVATMAGAASASPAATRVRELAGRALAVIEAQDASIIEAVRRLASEGYELGNEQLAIWDDLLRTRAPSLAEDVAQLLEQDAHRMRQVLARTGVLFGSEDPNDAFVVAAADAGAADAYVVDDPVVERDRYLSLLGVLFERTLALLCKRVDADARVWTSVARRSVHRRDVGRFPLMPRNIGAAAEAAARFPLFAAGRAPRPKLIAAEVRTYDAAVPAGLTLADFAANRIRGALRRPGHLTWDRLGRISRAQLAMPVSATPRFVEYASSIPAIAATGTPNAAIWSAFEGAFAVRDLGETPRWAHDQAMIWCHVGRAWRGSRGGS